MPEQDHNSREEALRAAQIIAIALILGVLVFVGISLVLVHVSNLGGQGLNGVLIVLAGMFAAISLAASAIIPKFGSKPRDHSENAVAQAFVGQHLLQKAPLEGAAFFNVIAYIVENSFWSLVVVAFLVAAMITTFPTRTKLDHFIETHHSSESG